MNLTKRKKIVIICKICETEFEAWVNRKWHPAKYCSSDCRKKAHRKYMRERAREKRQEEYKRIQVEKNNAHRTFRELTGETEFRSGIDDTHQSWDFMPAQLIEREDGSLKKKKNSKYEKIGTIVPDRDLRVVMHEGEQRVFEAVRLFSKKERKKEIKNMK